MHIEIWSDIVCPWCYIGKRRLESALAEFPHADLVQVVFRSFELDPSAPREGTETVVDALARKYGGGAANAQAMMDRVAEVAADAGLNFDYAHATHTSTVDAHRLLHLALAEGGPERQRTLKEALLDAYFAHGRSVGDIDVLSETAVAAGLPADRVSEVLQTQQYAEDVAADIAQARAFGVTGVPFFVFDRKYAVAGAQPTEVFTQVLERAWAEANPVLDVVGSSSAIGEASASEDVVCGPDGCAI